MEKTEIMRKIGNQCRLSRINSNLKQSDIARFLDTTQQNISTFENGENNSMYLLIGYIAVCDNVKPLFDFVIELNKEIKNNGTIN